LQPAKSNHPRSVRLPPLPLLRRPKTEWTQVAGRRIKIATGTKSQTVNVCTDKNADGVYEWIVRLMPPNFVTSRDLDLRELGELRDFLVQRRSGKLEPGRG
jgi:hypothetical protein